MNFTCDKCQRRYSIADDKVRGKTVKVRCKHCQNVISVEGPPAQEEESTRVVALADVERLRAQAAALEEEQAQRVSAPAAFAPVARAPQVSGPQPWEEESTRVAPMPRSEPEQPWYVMVQNQQQGPLEPPVLRELAASGTITPRSFFWRQGLADWKRGEELPELAGLFAAPPPPEPAPPPPPPEPPTPAPVRRAPEEGRRATMGGLPAVATVPSYRAPEVQPEPDALFTPAPEPTRRTRTPQPEPLFASAPEPTSRAPALAGTEPSWARTEGLDESWPQQDSGQDAPWQDEPQPAPRQTRAPAAGSAPQLGELFSDLDLPGRSEESDAPSDDEQEPEAPPARGKRGRKGREEEAGVGEHTRVAMVQSGVNRRNPWWKKLLFATVLLALPVAGAYLLDQLHVVPLNVTSVDARGKPVQQSVFTVEGASELRDRLREKLMGVERPPPAPAPAPAQPKPAAPPKAAPAPAPTSPAESLGTQAEAPSAELKAVYASGEKQDVGPEVREDAQVAEPDSADKSGPPPEELERVMGQVQPAIQACVEAELRRNRRFKGGKVMMVVTVGSSGAVKKVAFDRRNVEGSRVGDCIRKRARRMVFSSFQGEDVDLEVPLVLGTAL